MRRRHVLMLVGASAGVGFLARVAHGQDRNRRLGVLMSASRTDDLAQEEAKGLIDGLAGRGWHDGQNCTIEWRWAGGDVTLFDRYASELVALRPDALLAVASSSVIALSRRTKTIPIVFAVVLDAVDQGFVQSLDHPGGNITGFEEFSPPMAGKWMALVGEMRPRIERVGVLYDSGTAPLAQQLLQSAKLAAQALAIAMQPLEVDSDGDIDGAVARMASGQRGALMVLPSTFAVIHRQIIVDRAARYRIPAVYPFGVFAQIGGLMSYGIDPVDSFRDAAGYIDRIFGGARPSDLPVQTPSKFRLLVNTRTAEAIGVSIPESLLVQADQVIE